MHAASQLPHIVVFVAFVVTDEILLMKFDSYKVIAVSLADCASNAYVL